MGPDWQPGPAYEALVGPRTVRAFVEESKKLGLVPGDLEYEKQLPEEEPVRAVVTGDNQQADKGHGAAEAAEKHRSGSKHNPQREQVNIADLRPGTMQAQIIDDEGKTIGVVYFMRRGKDHPFESGRTGWHGQGNLEIGGKIHRANFLMYEATPKGPKEAAASG